MDTSGSSLPSPACSDSKKRRVCYYYDPAISNFTYGDDHHMVPRRVAMAHGLAASYGLLGRMHRLRTSPAVKSDLLAFHKGDYVDFLRDVTPENVHDEPMRHRAEGYGFLGDRTGGGYDNPAMDGLWEYCMSYTGGSLATARALGRGDANIAINWSGGMHHACASCASGFCYVNDIVLAIRELHNYFKRVLYVDIDVHHGDGVERAFFAMNRTMTVSFHQGGDMFPRTGKLNDVGEGKGAYHAVNVPLKAGMDDEGYQRLFKPVMARVMQVFQPDAVVLQCGADSLAGDRLGQLNLSVRGHGECVAYLRSFDVPLLLLGGGGYTINHVASCWCYETAIAIGETVADEIPHHGYDHYYESQGYRLHYPTSMVQNQNREKEVEKAVETIFQHLSMVEAAPSVQFQERRDRMDVDDDDRGSWSDDEDPIERLHRLCGEEDVNYFFREMGHSQLQKP